jgi:hypothetical protein
MAKDSRKSGGAAPLPATKSAKAQQTAPSRRSQVSGGRRSTRSSSGEADDAIAQNGNGKGKEKKAQPGEYSLYEHYVDYFSIPAIGFICSLFCLTW